MNEKPLAWLLESPGEKEFEEDPLPFRLFTNRDGSFKESGGFDPLPKRDEGRVAVNLDQFKVSLSWRPKHIKIRNGKIFSVLPFMPLKTLPWVIHLKKSKLTLQLKEKTE